MTLPVAVRRWIRVGHKPHVDGQLAYRHGIAGRRNQDVRRFLAEFYPAHVIDFAPA